MVYESVSYKHEIIFPLEFIFVFNPYISRIIWSKKSRHWYVPGVCKKYINQGMAIEGGEGGLKASVIIQRVKVSVAILTDLNILL